VGWCSRSRPGRATSPSSWHGPGRYRINGLDISRTFVEIARKNAAEAGVSVDVQHGDVARMPFAAGTFDLIVCRGILTRLTFKFMLIRRADTREELAQFVSQSGFEKSWVEDTPIGFELWLTK